MLLMNIHPMIRNNDDVVMWSTGETCLLCDRSTHRSLQGPELFFSAS